MATSGDTTFNLTTTEIIQEALELIGVVGIGQSVNSEDYVTCLRSLNMMVKSWQQEGIFITHEAEATVFLVPGTQQYVLGGTSASRTGKDPVLENKTTSDLVATDTTVNLSTTVGMTALDDIGIVMDDGDVHWTTIASITDSNTLELTVAITGAANTGNYVFSYTNEMGRPLEISYVLMRNAGGTADSLTSSLSERKLQEVGKGQYKGLYNKGIQGTPVMFYQEKGNTSTNLYVWPTASNVSERLKVTYKRIIEDFDNTSDVADLPANSASCLAYNLAAYVAPKYGKEQKAAQAVAPIASSLLNSLRSDLQEKTKLKIVPRNQ